MRSLQRTLSMTENRLRQWITQADVLFCSEAPNADEAQAGASAGKSGQLLTKIISTMGLSSENVFTTNIMKWRPEHDKPYGNRPPTLEEMRFCLPYLKAQIKIIQPKVIVALGKTPCLAFTMTQRVNERRVLGISSRNSPYDKLPPIVPSPQRHTQD